jgi:hypothetical protein
MCLVYPISWTKENHDVVIHVVRVQDFDLDEAVTHRAVGEATKAVLSRSPEAVLTLGSEALRSEHVDGRFVEIAIHARHASIAVSGAEVVGSTKAAVETITRATWKAVASAWSVEAATNNLNLAATTCSTSRVVARERVWTNTTTFNTHDLASNATAMRRVLDAWQKRTDVVEQDHLGLRISKIDGSLNNVVGEVVTQHLLGLVADQHLSDEQLLGAVISGADTLLDDVGAELLLREIRNSADEALTEWSGKLRLIEIEYVLDNVVAEGVLNKLEGRFGDSCNELSALNTLCVIDATLQDATAVAMSTDEDAGTGNSIVNELAALSTETSKTLLDDMVAVEILDKINNTTIQGSNDHVNLLVGVHELDHLLEGSGAVLVESDIWKIASSCGDEGAALLIVAVLEELLTQIVSKRINHQVRDVRAGLDKDGLNVISIAVFELALKISAAVLIPAEVEETATIGLEGNVVEASLVEVIAASFRILTSLPKCTISVAESESALRLVDEWLYSPVLAIHVVGREIEAESLSRVETHDAGISSVARTEWSSTSLKSRLSGTCRVVVELEHGSIGEVAALTVVQTVVMELLLSLSLRRRSDTLNGECFLHSRHIVGGV